MKLKYIIAISWRNLMDRKVRTVLTIMGVVIGVGSITFLVALGYGFERMTTSQVASQGSLNSFDVSLEESDLLGITPEDVEKMTLLDGVNSVNPSVDLAGKLVRDNLRTDLVVNAYTPEYIAQAEPRLVRGNQIENEETDILVSVAALKLVSLEVGDALYKNLSVELVASRALSPSFEDGEVVRIDDLTVVGVIDDVDQAYVLLPYQKAKVALRLVNYNVAQVNVTDVENIPAARDAVSKLGFSSKYIGDTINEINSFFVIFRSVIVGFGVIGMVVAVLGMFNTLTVSLLERTREIGILKANGATRIVVWQMFLSEALIISFVGGMIGLLFGWAGGESINYFFNVYAQKRNAAPVDFFYVPFFFIVFMTIFISIMGFLIGLYPSRRASRIRVLDALKYE